MTLSHTSSDNNKVIESLQQLINKALAMDEETLNALEQLSGKIIMIEILNTDLQFYLMPTTGGIKVSIGIEEEPHVRVRSHPGSFVAMLLARKGNTSMPGDMEIIGDIHLIQEFQNIMFEFDPDWEEPVSRLLGDTLTHKLGRFINKLTHFSVETSHNLMMDISEYLRFEKKIIPDATEIDDFNKEVDDIRSATDRLEKRLEKLEEIYKGRK